MRILRHALAILVLPFVVVVVVPTWLRRTRSHVDTSWDATRAVTWLPRLGGVLLFAAGFALFAWCVALFARVGQGTLAPWDPTRRLVAVGPYRHVRNPMISGVAAMLAGEALLLGSRVLALWAAAFVLLNHVYFLLVEEPGLDRRFDESYAAYKRAVPRWLPRRRAWNGGSSDGSIH
jgi:protein-S-isoprenylcysteine O-methyltransferase Ste14